VCVCVCICFPCVGNAIVADMSAFHSHMGIFSSDGMLLGEVNSDQLVLRPSELHGTPTSTLIAAALPVHGMQQDDDMAEVVELVAEQDEGSTASASCPPNTVGERSADLSRVAGQSECNVVRCCAVAAEEEGEENVVMEVEKTALKVETALVVGELKKTAVVAQLVHDDEVMVQPQEPLSVAEQTACVGETVSLLGVLVDQCTVDELSSDDHPTPVNSADDQEVEDEDERYAGCKVDESVSSDEHFSPVNSAEEEDEDEDEDEDERFAIFGVVDEDAEETQVVHAVADVNEEKDGECLSMQQDPVVVGSFSSTDHEADFLSFDVSASAQPFGGQRRTEKREFVEFESDSSIDDEVLADYMANGWWIVSECVCV
jgi:hypothetical protein